jgi:hypothetical protein
MLKWHMIGEVTLLLQTYAVQLMHAFSVGISHPQIVRRDGAVVVTRFRNL